MDAYSICDRQSGAILFDTLLSGYIGSDSVGLDGYEPVRPNMTCYRYFELMQKYDTIWMHFLQLHL